MKSSIVHIGYHKTATNWFQRSFYPRVTNYFYVNRKTVRRALLFQNALMFCPKAARNYLVGLTSLPLILCEEELSGNFHTGGHYGCLSKDVAQRIYQTLPNAQIVIFIRNQVDMIASIYKQYIKEGGTYSPHRYLFPHQYLSSSGFSPYYFPFFSFDHFRYYPLIQYYREIFGSSQIHVFPYEAFKSDNRSFVDQMKKLFDLEVADSAVALTRPNPSYKSITLKIARLLNYLTYQDVTDKTYLIHIPMLYKNSRKLLKHMNYLSLMGRHPAPQSLLGQQLVDYIKHYYYENNLQMAQDLNLPLANYHYV